MKLLLDTCTFIWLCAEPAQLSPVATDLLNAGEHELFLSDISVMEITLKWSAQKLQLPEPPRAWVEHQLRTWSLQTVRVNREDMYRASELPLHHKDPFDRLLVAIALNHDATLLTPDAAIKAYPVSTRW